MFEKELEEKALVWAKVRGVTMFEKEAEEYAIENYETCLYDDLPYTNDSKAIEQAFEDGAEFGYNKCDEQLTKAKKLITRFIMGNVYFYGKETDLVEKAKQFLRELEE